MKNNIQYASDKLRNAALSELQIAAVVDVETEQYEDADGRDKSAPIVRYYPLNNSPEAVASHNRWLASQVELTSFRCDLCGHHLIYNCVVEHLPTGEFFNIGRDCCETIVAVSKTALQQASFLINNAIDRQAAGRAAHAARIAGDANEKQFAEANPEAAAAFAWAKAFDKTDSLAFNKVSWAVNTLEDIRTQARRKGSLSEKQLSFVLKLHAESLEKLEAAKEQIAKTQSAIAAGLKAPEGRQQITGTIVSTKNVESDFGTSTKCLIDLGNGTRVWGSVPVSGLGTEYIAGGHFVSCLDKGDVVTFTATFEISSKDVLFGFYKRPSKWNNTSFATRVAEAKAAQEAVAA